MKDDQGAELRIGDRIVRTAIDSGAPGWANRGTVVGLGRVRVQVQWDSYMYDIAVPHHSCSPSVVRRMRGAAAKVKYI